MGMEDEKPITTIMDMFKFKIQFFEYFLIYIQDLKWVSKQDMEYDCEWKEMGWPNYMQYYIDPIHFGIKKHKMRPRSQKQPQQQ